MLAYPAELPGIRRSTTTVFGLAILLRHSNANALAPKTPNASSFAPLRLAPEQSDRAPTLTRQ